MGFIISEFEIFDAIVKDTIMRVVDFESWEWFAVASEDFFDPRKLVLIDMSIGDHVDEFAGLEVENFGHCEEKGRILSPVTRAANENVATALEEY